MKFNNNGIKIYVYELFTLMTTFKENSKLLLFQTCVVIVSVVQHFLSFYYRYNYR